MPSKFDFLSPGIQITEVDESIIAPTPDEDGPIIIGRTKRGPALKPVKVRSMADYVSVFGSPIPGGQSESGDVWRDGAGCKAPTYASYAAQAWLASENSPVTIVRLLGDAHASAVTNAALAGWGVGGSAQNDATANKTAYGLFVIDADSVGADPAVDNEKYGTLAAIFYCTKGALTLKGDVPGTSGATGVSYAEAFIKSDGDDVQFTIEAWDDSDASSPAKLESIPFNFNRNSSKYIRNVLNTDPTLTNDGLDSSNTKSYWLGESFERNLKDYVTTSTTGQQYGILLALQKANETTEEFNWGGQRQSMAAAQSGWVIGNDSGAASSYSAGGATKMFKFELLHEGENMQREVLIAFEDLALPANPSAYPWSSFTVKVMDTSGNTLEKYSNLNLNPQSTDYIYRKIGDMYQTWDNKSLRYRSYGNFPNQSSYIRIVAPDSAPTDQAMLPFG